MNIRVQSIHFNADKKLLAFIEKKVEKLTHFYDRILGCDVVLKLENASDTFSKISELRIAVPGYDLFAKEQRKTFEEGVDCGIESLKKQLEKHKEKQRLN